MIEVSAVVLRDSWRRVLTVRKRGTSRFMLPGGKYESGETSLETARRECEEEIGVHILATQLRPLGTFRAPAANEDGHTVEAVVFECVQPITDDLAAAAEIEEVRWLDPRERPAPDDLAPLLAEQVLPALDRAD